MKSVFRVLTTSFTALNYFGALNIQLTVNTVLTSFASPCSGIWIVPEFVPLLQSLGRKPGSSYGFLVCHAKVTTAAFMR